MWEMELFPKQAKGCFTLEIDVWVGVRFRATAHTEPSHERTNRRKATLTPAVLHNYVSVVVVVMVVVVMVVHLVLISRLFFFNVKNVF